ncbi:hypothetical protein CTAYLR_006628 [Chrysophaeum taylorii]|uniref:Treble clef zinc finger domain-containing protein n=1 Tax=Chrysophaeum taylorii TaxID=2483200 RepID=A0AAD7XQ14_9STRA|nr:hypothetical protein CTAYLR_006628 [Chrysophaeum taylorii]
MPLPSWVREWLHPTRNARTTLSASDDDDDDASSWKIFQCPKAADHVWCARPADLAARGPKAACPCCALIQVSSTNCVKTTHPAIAEEWHPTKNGRHVPSPRETLSSAKAAVWFRCRRNDRHEWRAVVANRCAGEPCPFCAGKVALPFTTLVARLGRDLVYYFWHKRKNQNPPDQILSGADVPIRLKDPLTGTEWTTTPELLCQVAESVTYGGNAKEAIYSRFVSREERSRALALLKTALGRAESYLIDTILEDAFLAAGVPVTLPRSRILNNANTERLLAPHIDDTLVQPSAPRWSLRAPSCSSSLVFGGEASAACHELAPPHICAERIAKRT